MIRFLSAQDATHFKDKAVLLRLDFNTADDWRMRAALPTVKFLTAHARAVLILSHKGRPKGVDPALSLKKDAAMLSRLTKKKVTFLKDFDFEKIHSVLAKANKGQIFVLENLRFLPGEEKNDAKLAKQLAGLGDCYVNDAFAVSHRANASVVALPKLLTSYAGFGLEGEIANLSRVMQDPKKPLVMIFGGAKISDKLGILRFFESSASIFLMGGALANTLLALRGMDVKKSLIEKDLPSATKKALAYTHLVLPIDFVEKHEKLLDIGPRTVDMFSRYIGLAHTVVWNGPMGMTEEKGCEKGTKLIAQAIADNPHCFSVVGGGETVSALKKFKLEKEMSFISTGGGAMLEYLSGEKLPGIEALK